MEEAKDQDLQRQLQACADARGGDLPTAFVALNGAKAEHEQEVGEAQAEAVLTYAGKWADGGSRHCPPGSLPQPPRKG